MKMPAELPELAAAEYGACRAAVMEWLYECDGRHDPAHPDHSLYTGLAEKYRNILGALALEGLTRTWNKERGISIAIRDFPVPQEPCLTTP